jgi:ribulose-5-phosphate 4-epimerase/fuculose-1-phosphate aldolase
MKSTLRALSLMFERVRRCGGVTLADMDSHIDDGLDLVVAYRTLAEHGILDAYGHVSMRSRVRPDRFFLSRALAPELVTIDDILEFDLDSEAIDRQGRELYSERYIHGEMYRSRPDVNAVVHNHSPTIVPFSITPDVKIRPLTAVTSFIGMGVPTFEIRDFQMGSDMRIITNELGRNLASVVGDKPAALMRGHGAVVVAADIATVVARSIYLELAAQQLMQAMQMAGPGGRVITLDDAEVAAVQKRQEFSRPWLLFRTKALERIAAQAAEHAVPQPKT